jgi:hypothetical protein
MKNFRVTLKIMANGHSSSLSTTIPAYNNVLAIDKVIDAHDLAGQVTASRAEEVN